MNFKNSIFEDLVKVSTAMVSNAKILMNAWTSTPMVVALTPTVLMK